MTTNRALAQIAFDDGSVVVLDCDTELDVAPEPRTLRVSHGAVVADVSLVPGAPDARLVTPTGTVEAAGAKLALTAQDKRTSVEVVRGTLRLSAASGEVSTVSAGEEGVATGAGLVEVTPANDLAQRVAFGERAFPGADAIAHNPDTDAPVSGLGELRARRPGKTDEKDHAVHLASHAAKIRIAAGNQAAHRDRPGVLQRHLGRRPRGHLSLPAASRRADSAPRARGRRQARRRRVRRQGEGRRPSGAARFGTRPRGRCDPRGAPSVRGAGTTRPSSSGSAAGASSSRFSRASPQARLASHRPRVHRDRCARCGVSVATFIRSRSRRRAPSGSTRSPSMCRSSGPTEASRAGEGLQLSRAEGRPGAEASRRR